MTNGNETYWHDLDDKLSQVLALVGPALSASGCFLAGEFPDSPSIIQKLIDEGEENYVLTFLCEVLQEYRVPISPTVYALMENIGTMIAGHWAKIPGNYNPNFPPEMWEELKPQVVSQMQIAERGLL